MTEKRSYSQLYVHPETGYIVEMVAQNLGMLETWESTIIDADKIIGAQFYYTNPILYLLGAGMDPLASAPLYDNYYLMNISKLQRDQFFPGIVAVNSVFLNQIGKYSEVSGELSQDIESYHNQYGLYLVGIDVGASEVYVEAEFKAPEQS